MTKKVTYICDRCGIEFEDYEREYKVSKETYDYDAMTYRTRWVDLCNCCKQDLINFLNVNYEVDRSGDYPDGDDGFEFPDDEFDLD